MTDICFSKYYFTLILAITFILLGKHNITTITVFCLLIREAKKRFIDVESKFSPL